jgi:hypothetical protein
MHVEQARPEGKRPGAAKLILTIAWKPEEIWRQWEKFLFPI